VAKLKKHPLARALRLDKMTLAALEATLRLYLDPPRALHEIPALRMLAATAPVLQCRCLELVPQLQTAAGDCAVFAVVEASATVGGGAMPLAELPGFAIAVTPRQLSLQQLTERLRRSEPPVIGRVQDDRLLLDPRTLLPNEEPLLVAALGQALGKPDDD